MFKNLFAIENTERNFSFIMTTAVLLILAIPVGIANVVLGYIILESPCTQCWFERAGMIAIGIMGIFILRYGPRPKYIAMMVVSTWWGFFSTLRHTAVYLSADLGQGLGDKILGAHTYTWGVFVYWCALILVFVMMFLIRPGSDVAAQLSAKDHVIKPFTKYAKVVVIASFAVVVSNAFQALFSNGIPPFSGKGRPPRFSLDLEHIYPTWTTSVWDRLGKGFSLRGKYGVEEPIIAGVNEDGGIKLNTSSAASPVKTIGSAKVLSETVLQFEAKGMFGRTGTVTGISYSPKTNEFVFSTNNAGFYFTDAAMSKVLGHAVVDAPNGNDIPVTVDATYMADGKVIGIAQNKTIYGLERAAKDKVNEWWQWRVFREQSGDIMPVWGFNRWYLQTARAHNDYVASGAYDAGRNQLHLVSVPNNKRKDSVICTFDMSDRMIVSERVLRADKAILKDASTKKITWYVRGVTEHQGMLYALSLQYGLLLQISPETGLVKAAAELPAMSDVHSLTVKDGKFYTLGLKGGKNVVYEMANPF